MRDGEWRKLVQLKWSDETILWCVFWMRCICSAVITRDFCLRGSSGGWDSRRCCQHKEAEEEGENLMKFLIIPPPHGSGKNYWMPFGSVLFMELHLWNTSLPFFLSLFLSLPLCISPSLPPSPLIGDAVNVCGVSGSSRWGRIGVSP